jgi:peptide chain release factor subunit 1
MIRQSDLEEVAQYKAVPGSPVLSVYLDIDQGNAANLHRGYEVSLANMLRAIESRLEEAQLPGFAADAGRARQYVARLEPRGKGLILFCDDSEDFFWSREIKMPLRNTARWSEAPYLLPLLAIMDEYERYGIALVDKARARLFMVFMGEIEEEHEALAPASVKHIKSSGTDHLLSENRFQSAADMHAHWHLKNVADALEKVVDVYGFDRLLLAGTSEVTGALQRILPKRLRSRVVERVSLPVAASAQEVLDETLRIEEKVEREMEQRMVEELIAADGHHPVALGLDATVRALCEQRIWRLIYAKGLRATGGECSNCGILSVRSEGACDYCGGQIKPVGDLLEWMVQRVLEQDGKVEVVDGAAADHLRQAGAVGAVLRF